MITYVIFRFTLFVSRCWMDIMLSKHKQYTSVIELIVFYILLPTKYKYELHCIRKIGQAN